MSIHIGPQPVPAYVPGFIKITEVEPGKVEMQSNIPDKVQVITILLDIAKNLALQIKQEPERIVKPDIKVAIN